MEEDIKLNECSGNQVGIDDLTVYVPKLFLSATGEFAASRLIDPAKLTEGIGIERMAIPDAHEDAATMAAMSIKDLLERNNLKPDQIGKIYIGTESGVDEAKAIGTYVVGMLENVYGQGSFEECETVEFKSACIGATYALENLCNYMALNDDARMGIAVASDIAKYGLNTPGEYTQGAGSVSLLIKKRPRLIAFDGLAGSFTKDEDDFFRPLGSSTAVVRGKKSNQCYLMAVERAFASYQKKALLNGAFKLENGDCLTDRISHLLFHIPYPRMAEYASASIFMQEWRCLPRWKEIEEEIGEEPQLEAFGNMNEYLAADAAFKRAFSKTRPFQDSFNAKVKDSTTISRQVGNIYTGSLYLGLASLAELQRLVPGDRICFSSYGSGCSAMVFSGRVQQESENLPSRNFLKHLDERDEISLIDYELLHERKRPKSVHSPSEEFALINIDEEGYRHYDYIC